MKTIGLVFKEEKKKAEKSKEEKKKKAESVESNEGIQDDEIQK